MAAEIATKTQKHKGFFYEKRRKTYALGRGLHELILVSDSKNDKRN